LNNKRKSIILIILIFAFSGLLLLGISRWLEFLNKEKESLTLSRLSKETHQILQYSLQTVELSKERTLDLAILQEVFGYLKEEFFIPIHNEQLLNGALKELEAFLLSQGINEKIPPIKSIDNDTEDIEAIYQRVTLLSRKTGIAEDTLLEKAIIGFTNAVGDPYTVYLSPQEYAQLTKELEEKGYGGIGIVMEIEEETRMLTVLESLENTPASRAGLTSGDQILEIDGITTLNKDIDVLADQIRGPVGTKVTLTILRPSTKEKFSVNLTRERIQYKSVRFEHIPSQIGYIRIRQFSEYTSQEFKEALDSLGDCKAFIIDLRNNGGGYVDAAMELASYFLPKDVVVFSITGRTGEAETLRAKGNNITPRPIAMLVNKYTASASEILAGAWQDYKIATLIGEKTFGKGKVQAIFPLGNGGALKVTIARYFTPKSRNIDENGIQPDIELPMDARFVDRKDKKDVQLEKAVDYLKSIIEK